MKVILTYKMSVLKKSILLLLAISFFNLTGSGSDLMAADYIIPQPPTSDYTNGIKILAIGNSYTQNSLQYMCDLLKQLGVNENGIKLVCAFQGGASLKDHANNVRNNNWDDFQRLDFAANGMIHRSSSTLIQLIQEENWDIITLQQASWFASEVKTYNEDLDFLIDHIATYATSGYKLGWYMTWSSKSLGGSLLERYRLICAAVQRKIVPHPAFDFIIPTGTAIQNARAYFEEPDLINPTYDTGDEDNSHLNYMGRYIAAAMWVKTITGYDIENADIENPYIARNINGWGDTTYTIEPENLAKTILIVNTAAASPFTVHHPKF